MSTQAGIVFVRGVAVSERQVLLTKLISALVVFALVAALLWLALP